jgi:glycogen debranching enzyme
MTTPWSPGSAPPTETGPGCSPVTLIEGSTFCISDASGDILPGHPQGLFVRDTRVLCRWELSVDGVRPQPLTLQYGEPYAATFLGRMPPRAGRADSTLLVVRRRYLGDGMREDVTIHNTASRPASCVLAMAADADFADLLEVKHGPPHWQPGVSVDASDSELVISSPDGNSRHGVLIRAGGHPAVADDCIRWQVEVPGHGERTVSVEATAVAGRSAKSLRHPRDEASGEANPALRLREWRRRGPQIATADQNLAAVLDRSIEDLGALRIADPDHPERYVVAAGAPWFMTLFGRDSLLTSWMLLPWDTGLAIGTLQTLAARQGTAVDAPSEEEPGRILHEVRFGPATELALGGRSVYYGTADATPLFVMLLGELQRWGRDGAEVQALLPHADRALEWVERFGDADGDGFVEYCRKTEHGLANQGWKDSWDGVNFADGQIADPPIALAEVQGYVYAAYRARAHFARQAGDEATARACTEKAERLKRAFNEAFWLPDREWYAIALDRRKRPVDALASNMGHCLWTGIVDEDKAPAVADRLLSDDMFSGWGIRTLAGSMAAYNPMSYHNGSVWPHDNAICAAGLIRYGFVEPAQRVAQAVLSAASCFGQRLPELFCGFARADFPAPVPYPTSCSPQAWAAAAPLQLLHSLLRFSPDLPGRRLWCDPAIPRRYLPLRVSGLVLGSSELAVDVREDAWELSGLDGSGVELIRAPRQTWPPR